MDMMKYEPVAPGEENKFETWECNDDPRKSTHCYPGPPMMI